MMKVLRIIRNIIFCIIFVVYLSLIILASTLVLNRNDYGYTQFGTKSYLDIREDTNNYLKGQLVVVKNKLIENLKIGDEVFIYQTNQEEKTVKIVSSTIKEVHMEEITPYITIDLDNTSWGQDYIAGEKVKVYDSIGGIMTFVESKWIFFVIFIVPCFFILLYEIYSVIIVIKFDGTDAAAISNPNVVLPETPQENADNITVLMNEINSLKSQLNQNAPPPEAQPTPSAPIAQQPEVSAVPSTVSNDQAIPPLPTVEPEQPTTVAEQPQVVSAPVAPQPEVSTAPTVAQPAPTPTVQPVAQPQTTQAQQVVAQPETSISQQPTVNNQATTPQPQAASAPVAQQPEASVAPTVAQSAPAQSDTPVIVSSQPVLISSQPVQQPQQASVQTEGQQSQ